MIFNKKKMRTITFVGKGNLCHFECWGDDVSNIFRMSDIQ